VGVDAAVREIGLSSASGVGVGGALFIESLHDMRRQGYSYAVLGWVAPRTQVYFRRIVDARVIEKSNPREGHVPRHTPSRVADEFQSRQRLEFFDIDRTEALVSHLQTFGASSYSRCRRSSVGSSDVNVSSPGSAINCRSRRSIGMTISGRIRRSFLVQWR
jgi:hypothetical protein